MGNNQINFTQIPDIQTNVRLYINKNGGHLDVNYICVIKKVRVVCEINGRIIKDGKVEVRIDENSPMKIVLSNNAWDASKIPLEYWYTTPKAIFSFDHSIGLTIIGSHPIHGNYKTTIYNK